MEIIESQPKQDEIQKIDVIIQRTNGTRLGFYPIKSDLPDYWLENFIKSMSHFLLFVGFLILASLFMKLFISTYNSSSEYLIIIYIMLVIYAISAVIIGRIGLNLNHSASQRPALGFLIGVVFLSIFLVLILIINFIRTMKIALKDPYNSNNYSWKVDSEKDWLIKQNNVVICLKWNITIIMVNLLLHSYIIVKIIKYYRSLKP